MFKRITNLWKLGEYEANRIGEFNHTDEEGTVTPLLTLKKSDEFLGDGEAEFLGEGTQEEFKAQEEADKGFKVKPFGL